MHKEPIFSQNSIDELGRALQEMCPLILDNLKSAVIEYRHEHKNDDSIRPKKNDAKDRLNKIKKAASKLSENLAPLLRGNENTNESQNYDSYSHSMLQSNMNRICMEKGKKRDFYSYAGLLSYKRIFDFDDMHSFWDMHVFKEKLDILAQAAQEAIDNHYLPYTPEKQLLRRILGAFIEANEGAIPDYGNTSLIVKVTQIIYREERINFPENFTDSYKPLVQAEHARIKGLEK